MKRIVTTAVTLFALACNQTQSSDPPGDGLYGTGAFGGIGGYGGVPTAGNGNTPGGGGGLPSGGIGNTPGRGGLPSGGFGNAAGAGGGTGNAPGLGGSGNVPGSGGSGNQPGQGGAGGGGGVASGYGCPGSNMLSVPDDPLAWGPYEVGVQTVTIGRLTVELLYPARAGSTAGLQPATYDLRQWLPASERTKVPDANSPAVEPIGGHVYRDVPIDDAHGPYPIVIMIHGTDSFRIANGTANATWASRGFVVLAADYPGMNLTDALCSTTGGARPCKTVAAQSCGTVGTQDVATDVKTQLDALKSPSGSIASLAGHIDVNRVGIAGHSQGACLSAGFSTLAGVQVVIPIAGVLSVMPSSTLKSVLFLSGITDAVMPYGGVSTTPAGPGPFVCAAALGQTSGPGDTGAYTASPGPPGVKKRLVGITGGGHLSVTDLCRTNAQGKTAVAEADADQVCGMDVAVLNILPLASLNDCGTVNVDDGMKATTYATTAALEETLQCADRTAQFTNIKTAVPVVGDFQQAVQ